MSLFLINRDDLADALKKVTGEEKVTDDMVNEFVVVFGNRIDSIIEEEARKYTGVEPPVGFA